MTRPERASEPSMDEILASIRKIIAEEPRGLGLSTPTPGREPKLPAAATPAPAAAAPTPAPTPTPDQASKSPTATGSASVTSLSLKELAAAIPRAVGPSAVGPAADDDLSDLLEPDHAVAANSPVPVAAGPEAKSSIPPLAAETHGAEVASERMVPKPEPLPERLENALGALAVGLAAAPKAVNVVGSPVSAVAPTVPEPVAAPVPETAAPQVFEAPPAAPAAGQVAPSPTTPSTVAQPGQPRSLEDAVVELLRPMLRKWLDDNLPKIVERALLAELAQRDPPKR